MPVPDFQTEALPMIHSARNAAIGSTLDAWRAGKCLRNLAMPRHQPWAVELVRRRAGVAGLFHLRHDALPVAAAGTMKRRDR